MSAETAILSGQLQLGGRLDERFFKLLTALQNTGSLHKAASAAGYSYKGAWLVLDAAGNLLQTPITASSTGGVRGGGTQLTPAAQRLLGVWQQLQEHHSQFIAQQDAWLSGQQEVCTLFKRMSMKITARNQFVGKISKINQGGSTAYVTLKMASEQSIVAALPTDQLAGFKLKKGQELLAFVKSSEVVLLSSEGSYQLLAANKIAGTISRLQKGAVTTMVGLTLPGGLTLSASVTNDAADALGFAIGQSASAVFQAYAVMLAIPKI